MKLIKLVTSLLGFALIIPVVMVACGGGGPQERTFELEIREQSLVQEESVLRGIWRQTTQLLEVSITELCHYADDARVCRVLT